jgi:hypothetical protein
MTVRTINPNEEVHYVRMAQCQQQQVKGHAPDMEGLSDGFVNNGWNLSLLKRLAYVT